MTPAEHYNYGQYLLKGSEQLFEVDHSAAASQAIIAQAHFAAAAQGTALRALEALAYPAREVDPPCGQEPYEHAPDGGSHPAVGHG